MNNPNCQNQYAELMGRCTSHKQENDGREAIVERKRQMKLKEIMSLVLGLGLFLFAILSSGSASSEYKFDELTKLADKYGTDKGSSWHYYTQAYEYFFYPIKYEARKICEIGVAKGASLKMFRDYFPNAVVYGIDINDSSELNSDTIKTFIADQANRKQLKDFIDTYGGDFDIILDDGGHSMEQQQVSFGYLFRHLKPGGYYIIEDAHTSFRGPKYGIVIPLWNATLTMIDKFIRTGKIESKYMTTEERTYLTTHIEYCNLFKSNNSKAPNCKSISCIFKKKVT